MMSLSRGWYIQGFTWLLYDCLHTNTFFQPPPQSLRPEVIEYQILHNIIGSVMVKTAHEMTCVFMGVEVVVYNAKTDLYK